jgi:hypothetical protein
MEKQAAKEKATKECKEKAHAEVVRKVAEEKEAKEHTEVAQKAMEVKKVEGIKGKGPTEASGSPWKVS